MSFQMIAKNETTPLDILHEAMAMLYLSSKLRPHENSKPGEVIEYLSKDKREILKHLKYSDIDLSNLRSDYVQAYCHVPHSVSDLKLEFDRKNNWTYIRTKSY